MRASVLVALLLLGLLAGTGTAVAANNTAPLADAGVDQTVPVGATVYLDANGSVDPDGSIERVSWSIETPDGETISPDCDDCRRTEFEAPTVGQYAVTLTVTDDDEATTSDTLYVTVRTERGPDVAVSGPTATTVGSSTTFTADVTRDRASLETLAWLVDGDVVERHSLDGASADVSLTHSFSTPTSVPVRAVVYDTLGNRGSASDRVVVVRDSDDDDSSGPDNTTDGPENTTEPPIGPDNDTDGPENTTDGPGNDTDEPDPTTEPPSGGGNAVTADRDNEYNTCEQDCADKIYTWEENGVKIYSVADINGEPGVQLNTEDGLANYGNLAESEHVTRGINGNYRVEKGMRLSEVTDERLRVGSSASDNQTAPDEFIGSSNNGLPDTGSFGISTTPNPYNIFGTDDSDDDSKDADGDNSLLTGLLGDDRDASNNNQDESDDTDGRGIVDQFFGDGGDSDEENNDDSGDSGDSNDDGSNARNNDDGGGRGDSNDDGNSGEQNDGSGPLGGILGGNDSGDSEDDNDGGGGGILGGII